MSRIPTFKDLEVWKKAMDLVDRVYDVTELYPAEEHFGLVYETRKSARSVPANLAEGKKRTSEKEFRHFVSIASGSLAELHTQILMASRRKYLPMTMLPSIESDIDEIGRMIFGLERALFSRF
ncbi:MAG: four helix bundle protein [Planctomycetaceae bacterium]|nr:four helix bundle protein [Planctomycetaceae bacterium]